MSNKDIETNINENTEKSETPKKKNIVHVFRPQNTQNGGNKGISKTTLQKGGIMP